MARSVRLYFMGAGVYGYTGPETDARVYTAALALVSNSFGGPRTSSCTLSEKGLRGSAYVWTYVYIFECLSCWCIVIYLYD